MGAACTSTAVGGGPRAGGTKATERNHAGGTSASNNYQTSRDSQSSFEGGSARDLGLGSSTRRMRLMSSTGLEKENVNVVVEVTPPILPRRLSKESSSAENSDQNNEEEAIPISPQQVMAHKVFRVKVVKNIVTGDESLNVVRREMCEKLRRNHASENIEFMYEVQGLMDLVKAVQGGSSNHTTTTTNIPNSGEEAAKELHHAITNTINEFIEIGAPHEVCITRSTREAILASAQDPSNDLETYQMLHALAFGEILADTVQNPEFQLFLYRLVEEGVVELKAPPMQRQTYVEGKRV